MLSVQEFLHAGNPIEALTEQFGINVYRHPTLPLIGCKYSFINSPKTHPIVRDCRGIVLEDHSWNVIAKPFRRFYNAGEVADEYALFDWSDFTCNTKEDGCFLYNTPLNLWGGGTVDIGDIVTQKLNPTLVGMDQDGKLVPCQVIDWFDNGTKDNWMELEFDHCLPGGHSNKLHVTTNHSIYFNGSFRPAFEACKGDIFLSYDYKFDESGKEIAYPIPIQAIGVKNLEFNLNHAPLVFPQGRKGFDISTTTQNYFANGVLVHNSLILVYYYGGDWHVNTSGSFGLDLVYGFNQTWQELFWKVSGIDRSLLQAYNDCGDRLTYIFELCTPWNKVVRSYAKPSVFLLSVFGGLEEAPVWIADVWASHLRGYTDKIQRPTQYTFKSKDEITEFLLKKEESDKTFEGVIIRDRNNIRFKIKTKSYIALHRMKDGGNIFNPKNLLPFVLAGDGDELFCYFPEVKDAYQVVNDKVDNAFSTLKQVWQESHSIENRKAFALSILGKTPFTGLLFNMRDKYGLDQTIDQLDAMWRSSEDAILKTLF